MDTDFITRYFPEIDVQATERYTHLVDLYRFWNSRINVVSRKDVDNIVVKHILHSLSLAKVIAFSQGETVIDIGTGGGLPGLPLAIMYPGVDFTLIDSTGKKIKVVESIVSELNLSNVKAVHTRAELFKGRYNYIVSRAVCTFDKLVALSAGKLSVAEQSIGCYGIYSLKGGDLSSELKKWRGKTKIIPVSKYFSEEFFTSKKIVYLPAAFISGR